MTEEKLIDSPLQVSFAIAVLTKNHADRTFVSFDQYRNRLTWSRLYRPAVVYPTKQEALAALAEITAGRHAQLTDRAVDVDLATLAILETHINFARVC
jgi:hypothetical protein